MLRIGKGFDLHRLVLLRPLIIGGVTIPHTHGLAGHSDADVLIHAIIDALVGALALGDIGVHFPDSDPAYKDIDSRVMLRTIAHKIKLQRYSVSNLDSTVIIEQPKLQKYVQAMRENIASDLEVDVSKISIKIKTSEKVGIVGRGEAAIAEAVVLLEGKE